MLYGNRRPMDEAAPHRTLSNDQKAILYVGKEPDGREPEDTPRWLRYGEI